MPDVICDFETRSKIDIKTAGLDNYCRNAEALILSWVVDDGPVHRREFRGEQGLPYEWFEFTSNPAYRLVAWNAPFERLIFKYSLNQNIPIEKWYDIKVLARSWSLSGSLDEVCENFRMPADLQKDKAGKKLIQLFSIPARDAEEQGLFGPIGMFNDWVSHPEDWENFCRYCEQDTIAERALWFRMLASPLPQVEWQGWWLDQKINDYGMPVNRAMVVNALELAEQSKGDLLTQIREITGAENPNSDEQIKEWLKGQKYPWGSLLKAQVDAELADPNRQTTDLGVQVLKLRAEASKRSYTKLSRMLEVMSPDYRLKHQFVYGGAARTFRWSGGDVQTQNLPRPIKQVKKDYQKAIDLINAKDYDTIKADYPSVLGMVSSSLRMMFQAEAGQKFAVCDLNAIENRVLGYLARCPGILDVFKHTPEDGGDPYIAFGTKMYAKPYAELWDAYKGGEESARTNCKPAVLGAGYGLGGGSMYTNSFGDEVRGGLWGYAKGMGIDITQEFAHESVKIFRASYPEVPRLWKDMEEGFKFALRNGQPITIGQRTWDKREKCWMSVWPQDPGTFITFDRRPLKTGGWLIRMRLPSGRCLHYLNCTIQKEEAVGNDGKPWIRDVIYYEGIEHSAVFGDDGARQRSTSNWGRVKTYGGKLVENAVQAFSRDLLLHAMILADKMGFNIFGMFHDEIATQIRQDSHLTLEHLRQCMSTPPPWALTVPLGAEGYEGQFYRK